MVAGQLRIAMLSAHSCPVGTLGAKDTGGMSVYIRELAGELGKQGHSVDVYTRVHDPKDPQIVTLGQNARLIHLRAGDEEINKLDVYNYLPDFISNLESFRQNNNLQYDLIFSHYWMSGWVGQRLQQYWGVPHIIKFHTLGAIKNTFDIGEREPELRIETERELVRNCQRIIASTGQERQELLRHYGAATERVSIIPCGVNLERFQPVDKKTARQQLGLPDDKVILFVGRIEPLKGITRLIEAMPHLQNGHKPRLIIIGGDKNSQSEMERLQSLCHELRIADSVSFPGMIKQEKLPYYYSAADTCVVPSYYESFGLVALESLACGTPVVATDVGDLKHIIRQGETGYVVTDNNPRHLADKIALVLSKPSADNGNTLSIRASVSQFSWSNIAETIIRECHVVLADYFATVT